MTTVTASHIALDDRGVAWIEGTSTKVIEVALDHIAHGWSPAEIHWQHPHLSLSAIYSALAYYHDHQAEFDVEIDRQSATYKQALAQSANSPLRQRLHAAGKL